MRRIALVVCLVLCRIAEAQTDPWSKTYENPGSSLYFVDVAATPSGYVAALSRPGGACVVYISREGAVTAEHCTNWTAKLFVAAEGRTTYLVGTQREVIADPQRPVPGASYLLAGAIDATGRVQWSRQFRTEFVPRSVRAASGGGLILAGHLGYDGPNEAPQSALTRIGANGAIEWMTVTDLSGSEWLNDVVETSDGFVAVGNGHLGGFAVKIGKSGRRVWHRLLDQHAVPGSVDVLRSGAIVAGGSLCAGADCDLWLAYLDHSGTVTSQTTARVPGAAELMEVYASPGGGVNGLAIGNDQGRRVYHFVSFGVNGTVLADRSYSGSAAIRVTAPRHGGGMLLTFQARASIGLAEANEAGVVGACLLTPSNERLAFQFRPAVKRDQPIQSTMSGPAEPTTRPLVLAATKVLQESPCSPDTVLVPAPTIRASESEQQVLATWEAVLAARDRERSRVRELLLARKFDELDILGDQFRRERTGARTHPNLRLFYEALAERHPSLGTEGQHLSRLEEWRRRKPHSVSALTALADAYIQYAFAARGGGFAHTVTDPAWKRYESLIAKAEQIVRGAPPQARTDANFHMLRMQLAGSRCTGWKEVAYDPVVKDLQFIRFYRTALLFSLPRWCGSTEELLQYAEYATEQTRDFLGEGMYGLFAWDVRFYETGVPFFAAYRFDWARVVRGLRDFVARNPEDLTGYHQLAYMAAAAGDRQLAREMFSKPQLAWSSTAAEYWHRQTYDETRTWAFRPVVESFMAAKPQEGLLRPGGPSGWIASIAPGWPPILLQSEIRLRNGQVQSAQTFLLETREGVVAIGSLAFLDRRHPMLAGIAAPTVNQLRAELERWSAFLPNDPTVRVELTPKPMTAGPIGAGPSRGVVLGLDGPKPPRVHALKQTSVAGSYNGMAYVVGCEGDSKPCRQTAYGARIVGSQMQFDDEVDVTRFFGSPVLDSDGAVIGIVGGSLIGPPAEPDRKGGPWAQFEDIREVLKRASAAQPAPSRGAFDARDPGRALLRSEVTLRDGTTLRGFHGFLVQTRTGPVGVSTFGPMAGASRGPVLWKDFLAAVQSWKLITLDGRQSFNVTPRAMASSFSFTAVLDLPPGAESRTAVLALRRANIPRVMSFPGEAVMVVACRKSGKGCTPAIYSGHVTGFGRDNSGGSKSSLIVGQEVDPGDVLGSPVLDANGLVIAVVVPPDPIGSPAPPGKRFLAVQLLVDMLRLAAVE